MSVLWGLGVLLGGGLLVVVSPIMLLMPSRRSRAKWVAAAGLVLAIVSVGKYGDAVEKEAVAAGFSSRADMRAAQSAGVTSASVWKDMRSAEDAERAEKDAKRAEQMAKIAAENEAACLRDLKCVAEKAWLEASSACEHFVERSAKYQFEWTDGFLDTKFTHYRWFNKDAGQVTFFGDKVKFQNGFGAWQNMIYFCDYDTKTKTVLDLRVTGGRI